MQIPEVKLQRQSSNATEKTAVTNTTHPTSPSSVLKRQTSNITVATQATYITAPDNAVEVIEESISTQDANKPAFGYHLTQKMAIRLARTHLRHNFFRIITMM